MSEQSPSDPPSENPKVQGGKSPEVKKPNWKVMILLVLALGVLAAAFMNKNQKSDEITFSEFRKSMEKGQVVPDPMQLPEILALTDVKEKSKKLVELKLRADNRLKFVTKDSTFVGVLQGVRDVTEYREVDAQPTPESFRIVINTNLHEDEFKNILRDESVTLKVVPSIAASQESATYSLKDLRKWMALGEVVLDGEHALKVFKTSSSDDAVLEGTRMVYPQVEGAAPVYKEFSLDVNLGGLSDSDRQLMNKFAETSPESNTLGIILMNMFPVLLIVGLLIFFFRMQMKGAGKGAMSFGKSKAKLLTVENSGVTFKDVAGIHEAKEELYEIVDFLKAPKKFEKLGANIPKGVLMVGSPGTGKTLLARAIAGEAGVPFFSISGSDFVEMFVGVGASRVRDMFEQGKKNAPCIVFIDEIDAVGRHRGQGMGGGNDEREQTLNALLVEMDGFEAQSGVIIIAATNRPDVLDPALLRPGRFDRQVRVSLPDVIGREEILQVHAKKIKIAPDADLGVIARGTPGFSGAELANLLNEAALLAARTGKSEVTIVEMEEARDKVRWGRERRSMALSDKEKANTAYHEAGHAILNILCEHTDPLHKVTIIPRGPSLGMAMFLPTEDKFSYRRAEMIDQLCVAMGGRVAEELTFGNPTNGAMGDIRQATSIARSMVCEWGMSDELGMVEYGLADSSNGFGDAKSYSDETARKIDFEIKQFIGDAYDRAVVMLKENSASLELIAQALIEHETLNGEQITDLLLKGEMTNPPATPTPPAPPAAPVVEEEKAEKVEDESEGDDPLESAGEVAPA